MRVIPAFVVALVGLAACGPRHVHPLPEPTAAARTARPLRVFLQPAADERAILPHHERFQATACAIVRTRPPALHLGQDAREFFTELVAKALRARGHAIAATPAVADAAIAVTVRECTVDIHRGFFWGDVISRAGVRLAVRRSDGSVVTEREYVEEWKEEVLVNLKRVYLLTLETTLNRLAQSLCDDDGLERALQRAGANP